MVTHEIAENVVSSRVFEEKDNPSPFRAGQVGHTAQGNKSQKRPSAKEEIFVAVMTSNRFDVLTELDEDGV